MFSLKLALPSSVGTVKLICSLNYSIQACTIQKRRKEAVNQQCIILEAPLLCYKNNFKMQLKEIGAYRIH